ncbi:MAG: hypothetical protein ACR2MQ_12925 [Gemmatimonadaceae bacterium]
MRRPPLVTLLVCIATTTVACGVSVSAARVSPVRYAPVPKEQVYVFTSVERVTRPYEEVALLDGSMNSGTLDAKMIEAMREKAGSLGANAIVLGDIHHPSDNVVAATSIASAVLRESGSIDVPARGHAVAIRTR